MIKHVVMFALLEETENSSKDKNSKLIKNMLEKLPSLIPEIKMYEVGINVGKSKQSFDMVLISAFENMEQLNFYLQHPEHLKAVEFLNKFRKHTVTVDYEI